MAASHINKIHNLTLTTGQQQRRKRRLLDMQTLHPREPRAGKPLPRLQQTQTPEGQKGPGTVVLFRLYVGELVQRQQLHGLRYPEAGGQAAAAAPSCSRAGFDLACVLW